ncbi:P-loop NTPase family protein [Devosia sp. A449]
MPDLLPLPALGRRICLLGPSNAGKSTLAEALSRRLAIPAVHLDQLHHLPDSDWVKRDPAEFQALHDQAILTDEWVMDGNYSSLTPQRFARATAILVVDDFYLWRLGRYFRRSLFEPNRPGGLVGQRDSIKWLMIHWIWKTRHNTAKYRRAAEQSGLPYVFCSSLDEINALYEAWGLERS